MSPTAFPQGFTFPPSAVPVSITFASPLSFHPSTPAPAPLPSSSSSGAGAAAPSVPETIPAGGPGGLGDLPEEIPVKYWDDRASVKCEWVDGWQAADKAAGKLAAFLKQATGPGKGSLAPASAAAAQGKTDEGRGMLKRREKDAMVPIAIKLGGGASAVAKGSAKTADKGALLPLSSPRLAGACSAAHTDLAPLRLQRPSRSLARARTSRTTAPSRARRAQRPPRVRLPSQLLANPARRKGLTLPSRPLRHPRQALQGAADGDVQEGRDEHLQVEHDAEGARRRRRPRRSRSGWRRGVPAVGGLGLQRALAPPPAPPAAAAAASAVASNRTFPSLFLPPSPSPSDALSDFPREPDVDQHTRLLDPLSWRSSSVDLDSSQAAHSTPRSANVDPSPPPAAPTPSTSAPPTAAADADAADEFAYADAKKTACLLCQRQLKSLDLLRKHNAASELHKVPPPFAHPSLRWPKATDQELPDVLCRTC